MISAEKILYKEYKMDHLETQFYRVQNHTSLAKELRKIRNMKKISVLSMFILVMLSLGFSIAGVSAYIIEPIHWSGWKTHTHNHNYYPPIGEVSGDWLKIETWIEYKTFFVEGIANNHKIGNIYYRFSYSYNPYTHSSGIKDIDMTSFSFYVGGSQSFTSYASISDPLKDYTYSHTINTIIPARSNSYEEYSIAVNWEDEWVYHIPTPWGLPIELRYYYYFSISLSGNLPDLW